MPSRKLPSSSVNTPSKASIKTGLGTKTSYTYAGCCNANDASNNNQTTECDQFSLFAAERASGFRGGTGAIADSTWFDLPTRTLNLTNTNNCDMRAILRVNFPQIYTYVADSRMYLQAYYRTRLNGTIVENNTLAAYNYFSNEANNNTTRELVLRNVGSATAYRDITLASGDVATIEYWARIIKLGTNPSFAYFYNGGAEISATLA